jgi:hypothetical protein
MFNIGERIKMKFRCKLTTGYNLSKVQSKKFEKLGFKFVDAGGGHYEFDDFETSYGDKIVIVDINSLDQLIKFSKDYGEIILNCSKDETGIEICNGFRE